MSGVNNVHDIQWRLEDLRRVASDPEAAGVHEYRLHVDVLVAIRDGAPNPAELAAEALKSLEIKFPRWCA